MGVEVGHVVAGKYRLLRQIGEGGMGSVWSAVHLLLDRNVAIKFLHLNHESERARVSAAQAAEQFEREAKSAARVSHRYVVDVFDIGVTDEGVHYMVQELLSGEELAKAMDEGPAWEAREVVRFMAQCLTALDAVHRAGLVHRDIKPENIYIARDAEGPFPKLLDFGICHVRPHAELPPEPPVQRDTVRRRAKRNSKVSEPVAAARTPARAVTEGTPAYMAPEQLQGLADLDGRADLYSVAVTMYEWLTGRLPYEQLTPEELCTAIAARSALSLHELRPDLSEGLSRVIDRALSPLPAERYESAAEMRTALLDTLPTLGSARSVVQKALVPAAIGSKTERILSVASCPFAGAQVQAEEEEEPVVPMLGFWRTRAAYLGAVATTAALVAFSVLPRANAPARGAAPSAQLSGPESTPSARPNEAKGQAHAAPSTPVQTVRQSAAPVPPVASAALVPTSAASAARSSPEAPLAQVPEQQPAPVAIGAAEDAPARVAVPQASKAATLAPSAALAEGRAPRQAAQPVASQARVAKMVRPAVAKTKPQTKPTEARSAAPAEAPDTGTDRGGFRRTGRVDMLSIAVQQAAPVEADVQERQLTDHDMRRLGM